MTEEPKDSASSSPDEHQHCPHYRSEAGADQCCICDAWMDQEGVAPADAETAEPEAPEEEHVCTPGATLYYCPTAGEVESSCHGGFDVCCSAPEKHILIDPSPRRPPYAIAYALASGELYEVALPGDAVATVEDGVLKVSHPEGVDRMVQVKPYAKEKS